MGRSYSDAHSYHNKLQLVHLCCYCASIPVWSSVAFWKIHGSKGNGSGYTFLKLRVKSFSGHFYFPPPVMWPDLSWSDHSYFSPQCPRDKSLPQNTFETIKTMHLWSKRVLSILEMAKTLELQWTVGVIFFH